MNFYKIKEANMKSPASIERNKQEGGILVKLCNFKERGTRKERERVHTLNMETLGFSTSLSI